MKNTSTSIQDNESPLLRSDYLTGSLSSNKNTKWSAVCNC